MASNWHPTLAELFSGANAVTDILIQRLDPEGYQVPPLHRSSKHPHSPAWLHIAIPNVRVQIDWWLYGKHNTNSLHFTVTNLSLDAALAHALRTADRWETGCGRPTRAEQPTARPAVQPGDGYWLTAIFTHRLPPRTLRMAANTDGGIEVR
jgi:hypothetical protein